MHVKNVLTTIDHHHGQASRTVIGGYPTIRGKSMQDKAAYYLAEMSWVHETVIREPRGHRNMLGAIITDPVSEEADFGLLYLHANGLFDGCGDSTFCAATAAIETGKVQVTEPVTRFAIDTVKGLIRVEADVTGGVVIEVRFQNVPSYFVGTVEVAGHPVDIAFGGNYFGFLDANRFDIELSPKGERKIIATALELWASLKDADLPYDVEAKKQSLIELFTFTQQVDEHSYKVANVYLPGRMGRTPSGTGTSAHVALRVAKGTYSGIERFSQLSIIDTAFTATAKECVLSGGGKGVIPTVGTKSYMMGLHQFVVDPADPFGRGFVMEG